MHVSLPDNFLTSNISAVEFSEHLWSVFHEQNPSKFIQWSMFWGFSLLYFVFKAQPWWE